MKKLVKTLALKTTKVVSLSTKQAQQIVGGKNISDFTRPIH
jgi:hypothetical protein